MTRMRLSFPSFDGKLQARIAHGDHCVLLLVETPDYAAREGLVLTSQEAAALGRRLIQQARASERVEAPQP